MLAPPQKPSYLDVTLEIEGEDPFERFNTAEIGLILDNDLDPAAHHIGGRKRRHAALKPRRTGAAVQIGKSEDRAPRSGDRSVARGARALEIEAGDDPSHRPAGPTRLPGPIARVVVGNHDLERVSGQRLVLKQT